MAGSVPQIIPNSIVDITAHETKAVFMVSLANMQTIVVKGESTGSMSVQQAQIGVQWSSKMMKNVHNSLVNTKVLTPTELDIFLMEACYRFPPAQRGPGFYVRPPACQMVAWVKMPKVQDLTDGGVLEKKLNSEKPLKEMITKFLDEATWLELGKILAVDIFSGNSDRFGLSRERREEYGSLANPDNLMFTGGQLIGLDTFHVFSPFGRMSEGTTFKELKILTDEKMREEFAGNCVSKFGLMIQGAYARSFKDKSMVAVKHPVTQAVVKVKTVEMGTMFLQYKGTLCEGIREGAESLKDYLEGKITKYSLQGRQRIRHNHNALRGVNPNLPMVPQHLLDTPNQTVKTMPEGVKMRMRFLGWQAGN